MGEDLDYLLLFFIVVLCFGFTIKVFQNDTFYLIKLGDYIVHNGIDLKDYWCWITGLSYTYPHWLFDVFIYLVYNNFGYFGIYVSTAILFIILILIIYIIYLLYNNVFNNFIDYCFLGVFDFTSENGIYIFTI